MLNQLVELYDRDTVSDFYNKVFHFFRLIRLEVLQKQEFLQSKEGGS